MYSEWFCFRIGLKCALVLLHPQSLLLIVKLILRDKNIRESFLEAIRYIRCKDRRIAAEKVSAALLYIILR